MTERSDTELETLERWTLARARQELGPRPELVARIQAKLGPELGLTGGGEGAAPPDLKLARPGLARSLPTTLGAALVTGLGGVALGLWFGQNLSLREASPSEVPKKPETHEPAPREIEPAEPKLTLPLEAPKSAADAQAAPRPVRATHPRRAESQDSHRAVSASKALPLYEELRYLTRAQTALSQGNFMQALGLMTELRSLAPVGSLLSEREVTEVLALCALGRTGEAQQVAARLRSRDKNLAYQGRLMSSCVAQQSVSSE